MRTKLDLGNYAKYKLGSSIVSSVLVSSYTLVYGLVNDSIRTEISKLMAWRVRL